MTRLDSQVVSEALEQGVSLESLMRAKVLNEWADELNAAAAELAQMPAQLAAMRRSRKRKRLAVLAQIETESLEADVEVWESLRNELVEQMETETGQTDGR